GYTVVSNVFGKQLPKSQPSSLSVVNCWNSRMAPSMASLEKCRSFGATRTVGNSCDLVASENFPASKPAPSKEEVWMNVLRFMSNQSWFAIVFKICCCRFTACNMQKKLQMVSGRTYGPILGGKCYLC